MAMMRLDKYMAFCGCGSRSRCKDLIRYGLVTVDGVPARSGEQKISSEARVEVDGEILRYKEFIYIMLNKPQGVISATYDRYKTTVVDLLEGAYGERELPPVGRLDEDTTGLLLLSDDGALAHFLLSPRRHVPKVYEAKLAKPVTKEAVEAFARGIELSDFTAQSAVLEEIGPCMARVTISEGKFHQVKRMFLACGNEVTELKRVSFGPLQLDETLQEGEWRELTAEEEELLRAAVKQEKE